MYIELIENTIKNLTKKYKKFLVGYSGGLDSTVLLYVLNKFKKYNINIRAIHINHNMLFISKDWEKNCINFCKKYKIQLIKKNIYINKKSNIENKLRTKRYKIFNKYIKQNEILLTAHHKNDQIETIFLSLKRGCGIKGLIGIKKKKKINNKMNLIRPFLNIEKKYIKKYAIKNKIKWVEDISNKNINSDRNFLRIIILPIIYKKWPFFISSIIRNSYICNKQYKLINYLIKKKVHKSINLIKNNINLNYILTLHKQEILIILKKFIYKNNKNTISFKLINLLLKQIIKNKNKTYFQIHFKKFIIYKYKNNLFIDKKIKEIKKNTILWLWKKNKNFIHLPNNIGLLYINNNSKKEYNHKNKVRKPYKKEKIYIKFQIKDKIKLLNDNKYNNIKKIWQKYKILPWKRNITPIIYYNNKPIMCPNIFITKYGNPKNNNNSNWNIIFKETK